MRLLYVMDPMCAWCYGFGVELEAFLQKHPSLKVDWIMGGLAPRTNNPMDIKLQETISGYWYEIEKRTRVTFNHDFWRVNTPYRSTYPACCAVISAEILKEGSTQAMVKAIQSAYYQEAKNPSLEETLITCASSIGLDEKEFLKVLRSEETQQHFQEHLDMTYRLQARAFPALFYLSATNEVYPLTHGYIEARHLEERLNQVRKGELKR